MSEEGLKRRLDHIDRSLAKKISPLWELAFKAMVPVSIVLSGWMIGLEVRVSGLEGSGFDNSDGHQMEKALKGWVENHHPPAWLKEDIKEIKDRLKEIEAKVK